MLFDIVAHVVGETDQTELGNGCGVCASSVLAGPSPATKGDNANTSSIRRWMPKKGCRGTIQAKTGKNEA